MTHGQKLISQLREDVKNLKKMVDRQKIRMETDGLSDKPKWWPENPHRSYCDLGDGWDEASEVIWNAMRKNMGPDLIVTGSILEAVDDALDGNEPSDFMMSFPIVRKAWDASQK